MQVRFPNIKEIWNFFIDFWLLVVIAIGQYGVQKGKKPIHFIKCVHKSTILKSNSRCKTQIYFTSGGKNPNNWKVDKQDEIFKNHVRKEVIMKLIKP